MEKINISEFGRIRQRNEIRKDGERYFIDFRPQYKLKMHSADGKSFKTEDQAQYILDEIRSQVALGVSPLLAISHYKPIYQYQYGKSYKSDKKWKLEYQKRMYDGARGRAKQKGLLFNIDINDLPIPDYCPVLGIPIKPTKSGDGKSDNAPSIDRINPSLGYIKGNVIVISWKANRIKSNHSAEDLKKVADWMEYLEHCPPICKVD